MDISETSDSEAVVVEIEGELPPAPIRRRVDYGPVTRVTVSMTEQEREVMKALAEQNNMKISQLVRLSLENQHFLESVVNSGGRIIVETNHQEFFEFNPIE